jgi:putative transposase
VTQQTFYRRRKLYGGVGRSQLARLKEQEKENQRLRRAVSDLTLDKLILTEATRGVMAVLELIRWINSGLNGRSP